jgi:hypothetical protein
MHKCVCFKNKIMGRNSIGTTNIKFSTAMYSSCWRGIQTNYVISQYGDSSNPQNLSLCKFLNYKIWPYVVGSNNTDTGQKGDSSSVGYNYSINTYYKNNGYAFYMQFVNTTNNTIRIDNPGATGWTAPGFGATTGIGTTNVNSGSGDTGKIGHTNINQSDTSQYFRIRSTPSVGYTFSGWYTAKTGGALVTTSSDYNLYYNYASTMNQARWFARNNVVAPSYWSTTGGFSPASGPAACYIGGGYTFYLPGSSGDLMTVAGPVYSELSPLTKHPTGYLNQGSQYRFWNNPSNNFFPANTCTPI